jgi:hypothetical protein
MDTTKIGSGETIAFVERDTVIAGGYRVKLVVSAHDERCAVMSMVCAMFTPTQAREIAAALVAVADQISDDADLPPNARVVTP